MAKKRSAQLDAEIQQFLSGIQRKPSLKTRPELDAAIDRILGGTWPAQLAADGAGAERYEVANALGFRYPKKVPSKPKSITGTNLFALTDMVLQHGPEFPSRVDATRAPHLKRCFQLGLIEAKNPSTMRLTPSGREMVADNLIRDIERESKYQPREHESVRPDLRAEILERDRAVQRGKLADLERALAKLR
jgi:hypothetical protein